MGLESAREPAGRAHRRRFPTWTFHAASLSETGLTGNPNVDVRLTLTADGIRVRPRPRREGASPSIPNVDLPCRFTIRNGSDWQSQRGREIDAHGRWD